jgi:hypothetical protein
MELLERRILEFLVTRNGVYVNPHGVVVTLMRNFEVHVSVGWPGKRFRGGVAVEYFYNCGSVGCFVREFGIGHFADLGRIRPGEIVRLYLGGDGWVFCLVNEGYLVFQKMKGCMRVVDDGVDRVIEISGLLNDSEEFINYTRGYYSEKYNKLDLNRNETKSIPLL